MAAAVNEFGSALSAVDRLSQRSRVAFRGQPMHFHSKIVMSFSFSSTSLRLDFDFSDFSDFFDSDFRDEDKPNLKENIENDVLRNVSLL